MSFLQLYGLTETSPLVTAMIPGSDNYTSSGFAVSNTELRIVDSEQQSLGPNEVSQFSSLKQNTNITKSREDCG